MTATFPAHLESALEKALALTNGTHDRSTVQNALDCGILQLWSGEKSFVLTEVCVAPTGLKTVNLFLAGGEPESLEELHKAWWAIKTWAQQQGAKAITMLGRPGWERTFLVRDEGFRPTMTYYVKELR